MNSRSMRTVVVLVLASMIALAAAGCGKKSGGSSEGASSSSSGSSMSSATDSSTGAGGASGTSGTGASGASGAAASGKSGAAASGASGAAASGKSGTAASAAAATYHQIPGSKWQVVEVESQAAVTQSQASLDFDKAGKVSGNTGCNDFTGTAHVSGKSVKFAPFSVTKRACQPELLSQETRMLKALGEVTSYEISADGQLHLNAADGTTLLQLTPISQ